MPRVFSWGSRQAKSQMGGSRGTQGLLLLDWFRLGAAALMTMALVMVTTMAAGKEGKDNNQQKRQCKQWW